MISIVDHSSYSDLFGVYGLSRSPSVLRTRFSLHWRGPRRRELCQSTLCPERSPYVVHSSRVFGMPSVAVCVTECDLQVGQKRSVCSAVNMGETVAVGKNVPYVRSLFSSLFWERGKGGR